MALPEAAARALSLKPGARLTLVDRLDGPAAHIRVSGLYRPAQVASPYWQLDVLGGRGIKKVDFTTYGPLLADPALLRANGRVSEGPSAWLASADFSTLTTGRIDALRDAARDGPKALVKREPPALAWAFGSVPVPMLPTLPARVLRR